MTPSLNKLRENLPQANTQQQKAFHCTDFWGHIAALFQTRTVKDNSRIVCYKEDFLLACEFWARKALLINSQVVKQAVKLSCVSLGCCFKDSLSGECCTINVANTGTILSEM